MQFSEKLLELRKINNVSQQELANRLGFSKESVCAWEKSRAQPNIETLQKLADVFGVSIDYLVGREDDFGNVNVVGAELSAQEQELLSLFKHLGPFEREAMLIQMKALKESNLESIKK